MSIKLTMPYKIAPLNLKRYESHYKIPALQSLIVPIKMFGEEVSCDIRWLDEAGELQILQNKFFLNENLEPIAPFTDSELYDIWSIHYKQKGVSDRISP